MTRWESVFDDPPRMHQNADGSWGVFAMARPALEHLALTLRSEARSLETGCGATTAVFADHGCHHTVVVPSQPEIDTIRDWLEDHGVSTERVTFRLGPSETVLPSLAADPLDVVVIDGRHGFPAPMVDWFYTAGRLVVGGTMVLDDTQIWPVAVLHRFLAGSPDWHLDAHICCTAFYVKIADGGHAADWDQQPFVLRRSWPNKGGSRVHQRVVAALRLLVRGEARQFARRAYMHTVKRLSVRRS